MKRYWAAWLNEVGKLAVGLLFAYVTFYLWFSPVSNSEWALGVAIGLVGMVGGLCLIDIPFGIHAIYKGTHPLLRPKEGETRD